MRPSFSKILLRGLLIAYLTSGLLLLLLAFLLYKLNLSESQTGTASYILYLLSCILGGFVSGKVSASRRFFWGLLTGICYALLLLLLSILFHGGTFPELSQALTLMGICMAGGIFGGIIS